MLSAKTQSFSAMSGQCQNYRTINISPASYDVARDLLWESLKQPCLGLAAPPVSHHVPPHLLDHMTEAQPTGCSRLGNDEMHLKKQRI